MLNVVLRVSNAIVLSFSGLHLKSAPNDDWNEETETEMSGSGAEMMTGAAMILCTIEYKLTPIMLLTAIDSTASSFIII